jgi:hypothetical protein
VTTWFFSPANSLTRNHVIPLLIVNYWLPMQPSNISAIFAKVEHFSFGQISNHLSLPFLVFQPPFHPDNSPIWHSFQSLMCICCICPV